MEKLNTLKTILITTSSFGTYSPGMCRPLETRGFTCHLNPFGRKLTEQEVSDLIEMHSPTGIIAGVEPLTHKVLEKAENLVAISRAGIGMDAVDLEAAGEYGILVTNTPDAPTIPVAELTLGAMLALLRRLHVSDAGIRCGQWARPMGNLLYGKTVGIIGCGRIGSYLARLVTALGCNVLGFDPFISTATDGITLVPFDILLGKSDIVSLHLPYTPENHHLIGASVIASMKKEAFLINASRGGLVDEEALFTALKSGHLAGAALDSFEQEPYHGPLTQLENVLLTGHIGSYAVEGRMMMEQQAVENLLSSLRQKGAID